MAEDDKAPEKTPETPAVATPPLEQQAQDQSGQRQVRIRLDRREMKTNYANAVYAEATPDEMMLYFALNVINAGAQEEQPEILSQINERLILNYFTAKHLALTLGNLIRRHEEQFGEIELDVTKRMKNPPQPPAQT